MDVVNNKPVLGKLSTLTAMLVPLLLVSAGCSQECVDRYDCRSKQKEGQYLTCVDNKCVEGTQFDAGAEEPDPDPDPDAGSTFEDAGIYEFAAKLTPAQEVPVHLDAGSAASGTATVTVDLNVEVDAGFVQVAYTLAHDVAEANGAHIHLAPVGVKGPVIAPLTVVTDGGTASGTALLSDDEFAELQAGNTYVNVHAPGAFADGEIRGQLLPPGQQLFVALLSPLDQTPASTSTASGVIGFIFDPATGELTYSGGWTDALTATDATLKQGVETDVAALAPVVATLELATDGGFGVEGGAFTFDGGNTETTEDGGTAFRYGDGGFFIDVKGAGLNERIRGQLLAQ